MIIKWLNNNASIATEQDLIRLRTIGQPPQNNWARTILNIIESLKSSELRYLIVRQILSAAFSHLRRVLPPERQSK
jgi:hypothetical protein